LCSFAKENGYSIRAFHLDNGYSGLSLGRPGLQGLIGDIEAEKVKCVIMTDLCRLSRDFLYLPAFLELCARHNVFVTTIEDGGKDVRNPHSGMATLITDFYKRQKAGVAI
jgi:DNA invertase Pin-like site-specific DNA recombinase